ncbi:Ig-like domain-containing protein [Aquabacterium sp. A08]|uniref:Ig-like domain-containing protein n=1 Tax=Aquabacterium sp. A08 TaxID=2718532 RepID=UPI00141EB80F|nr:Ig-like domain-containing protein [Aquabacterium sp. A08]NIC40894.1 hypothetical protein [Aquabacterium sp. A08]
MQAAAINPTNAAVEVIPVIRGAETVLVPSNQPLLAGDRVVTADKAVDVRVRNAAGTQEAVVRVAPNSEIVVGKHGEAGAVADVEVLAGDAAFVDPFTEEAVTMAKTAKSGAVLAGDSGMLLAGALLGGALLGGALDDNGGTTVVPGGPGNPTDPDAPPLVPVIDDVESNTGEIPDGGLTNDNTPSLLVGTLPNGITPVLLVDGREVPSTYDPATGLLTPNSPIPDGSHELAYKLRTEDGSTGPASPSTTVVIDSGTDDPSVIVSGNGSVVSGQAEPGSTVVIQPEGRDPVTVVADDEGNYSAEFVPPLADNSSLTVTATDEAGNTSNPVSGTVPEGGNGPIVPVDPPVEVGPTLLSGAAVVLDNLTDTVDTLSDSLGLSGLTDPLTQGVVDPLVGELTGLLDNVLIGADGQSGLLGTVGELGDTVAALGEDTALAPVTGLLGDLVGNLADTLNTLVHQDALLTETGTTTTNLTGDLGQLTGDLTAGLDAVLGGGTLVQDLLDPTLDSLLGDTVGTLLLGGQEGTLLGGVASTVDNTTDVVQTLGTSLGVDGLTAPLGDTVDATVNGVVQGAEDLLIADGGLTDALVDLGTGIAGSGDTPLASTVGDLVVDIGGLADTLAETDVLSGETNSASGDLATNLTELTGNLTGNLDDTLGTDDLVSGLLDSTVDSLANDTLTPVLSGSDDPAAGSTQDGGVLEEITQPLVNDPLGSAGDLLGGLLGQ